MATDALPVNTFVEFDDRESILRHLRSIEVYESGMEPMFCQVAERVADKAYDRSAFVFILLEAIYEYEEDTVGLGDLLGRMVFCLTRDLDLVGMALDAFEEIRETLEPEIDAASEDPPPPLPVLEEEAWEPGAEHEYLMLELQLAQKRVIDLGLATRASIEMSLARPSGGNVRQTLREISIMRSNLLRFEQLLRESEEQILEAMGVLGSD
ncbi:MAG: hypothetical protein AAGC60_28370 [Acidobacteriota bacterium]